MDTTPIWAKKNGSDTYPLANHLKDTAAAALALYNNYLTPPARDLLHHELGDKALQVMAYIAATHDLGKATPFFACKPYETGHDWDTIRQRVKEAGLSTINDEYEAVMLTEGDKALEYSLRRHEQQTCRFFTHGICNTDIPPWVGVVGLGHHGKFVAPNTKIGSIMRELHEQGGWYDAQNAINNQLLTSTGITGQDIPRNISRRAFWLLIRITITADRIASQKWETGNS